MIRPPIGSDMVSVDPYKVEYVMKILAENGIIAANEAKAVDIVLDLFISTHMVSEGIDEDELK